MGRAQRRGPVMAGRATRVGRPAKKKVNPLVARGITEIDWKDTSLLRTFVSDRGKIRSRRVTGLTGQQQRQVAAAIKTAREMALLPYTSTAR